MDNSRIERIVEAIKANIVGEFEIEAIETSKNNNITFYGFTFSEKNPEKDKPRLNPVIYYNPEWEDDKIVQTVTGAFKHHLSNTPQFSIDALTNKDYILENVRPALLKKATNHNILVDNKAIWREFLDLAIVYKVKVNDNSGNIQGNITINEQIADRVGVTEAELYEASIKNMENSFKFKSMVETILGMNGFKLGDVDIIPNDPERDMMIVSNSDNYLGAIQILNPRIMKILDDMYPNGCYAIPSSIHEMIIVPKNMDITIGDLQNMVKEVNNTEVAPCEVLSNSIYSYKNGVWTEV